MPTDIMELSNERYFKIPALSKSQIKNFNPYNPMAFWLQSAFNPNKAADEFGDYLVRGKLYHAMLFERHTVKDLFEVNDELGKQRINKKWQAAQALTDKLLISSEELDRAEKMMLAISRQEIVRKILDGSVMEKPFTWHEKAWGIDCKTKMDAFKNTTEGIYVIDYKTTSKDMDFNFHSIDKAGFEYDIGMYNRAIKAKYGQPIKKFIFILQSTNEGEENMIRVLVVEGPQIDACEIATELAVKQIVPRIKAWQTANAIVCAEVDPVKHAEELAKKEDAMLRCWLPEIVAEPFEVSPWFDKKIAESVDKESLITEDTAKFINWCDLENKVCKPTESCSQYHQDGFCGHQIDKAV